MNTNDFSRCEVGDKLWCIQLGECTVCEMMPEYLYPVVVTNGLTRKSFTRNGREKQNDRHQSLFFSNPNIIAPPEPPRIPDYKPGQWIAVWDHNMSIPILRKFIEFDDDGIHSDNGVSTEIGWEHHCSLEELPAVLEKWGEK